MKKLNLFLIGAGLGLVLLTSILLNGCKKDELKKNEETSEKIPLKSKQMDYNVTVQNGILVFHTVDDMLKYLNEGPSNGEDGSDNYEKGIGFKSMGNHFHQIIKAEKERWGFANSKIISKEEAESLRAGIIKQGYLKATKEAINNSFIKIIKDDNEENLELNNVAPNLARVLNIDGIVKIGDTIYQYTQTTAKKIIDGDFNKIPLMIKAKTSDRKNSILVAGSCLKSSNKLAVDPDVSVQLGEGEATNCNAIWCKKITSDIHLRIWNYSDHRDYQYYVMVDNRYKDIFNNWVNDDEADSWVSGQIPLSYWINGSYYSYYMVVSSGWINDQYGYKRTLYLRNGEPSSYPYSKFGVGTLNYYRNGGCCGVNMSVTTRPW
jgi:hypothetical protein